MSHHIVAVPLLAAHPAGWLILGAAGYAAFAAGKKAGRSDREEPERISACDRAVKGVMKTAYKAKMKVDKTLASTKSKYGDMWREAQAEATAGKAEPAQ